MVKKPVQVIAVTGGKGGVGKTNCSVNMAIAMAAEGRNVLLMDADLGLANVDVLLGLRPMYNLSHVLDGVCTLEDAVIIGPHGVQIIPASSGIKRMAELGPMEHAGIIQAFSEFKRPVDTLIIDTAAGISDSVISFSQASQHVLVVVCDEPASMTDAYALIKVLNQTSSVDHFHVISNMVRSAQQGRELFEKLMAVTDKFLDVNMNYLGMVPQDDYLKKAIQRRMSVIDAYPGAPSALAFKKLIAQVEKLGIPDGPRGNLEFFIERLLERHTQEDCA